MAEPSLRLGTRGSPLALAQAELVADALGGAEIVRIKTSGDREPGESTGAPGGDKGRFVREIERALLDGEVDLGIHSAKDLPSELPDGLEIAGVPAREDPRDAFVGEAGSLDEIREGARIGTSSLRRRAQLLSLRPDLEVIEVHGNVDTRLHRLSEGDFDGLILAAAGLRRLDRASEIAFEFESAELTPAPGQGALAIEGRHANNRAVATAQSITNRDALATLSAERAVVSEMEATCNTPLGVHATIDDGAMLVCAFCGLPDGSEWLRDELGDDASDPEAIGRALAERMTAAGAVEILERAERMAVSAR